MPGEVVEQIRPQLADQLGVEPKRISDSALAWLSNFNFPGNVRQLENICHWLTVMAPSQVVEAKDLPPEVLGAAAEQARALGVPADALPAGGDLPASSASTATLAAAVPENGAPATPAPATWPAGTVLGGWEANLEAEALALLVSGQTDVWDVLTRRFESKLIQTALVNTRGRRIEAAQKLGIGRNTITRKIQELGLE